MEMMDFGTGPYEDEYYGGGGSSMPKTSEYSETKRIDNEGNEVICATQVIDYRLFSVRAETSEEAKLKLNQSIALHEKERNKSDYVGSNFEYILTALKFLKEYKIKQGIVK